MKKKANGTFRAWITARGFKQIDDKHYDSLTTAAPVVNNITIKVMMVLMIVLYWYGVAD